MHVCLYDISTKAFSDRVKKAAALENISQELNVAGWYITHHNAAQYTGNKNTTDRLRADWLYAVQLPIVGDSWVASVRVSIATQLNSTSSWMRRYKRAFTVNRQTAAELIGGCSNYTAAPWQSLRCSRKENCVCLVFRIFHENTHL